MSDEPTVITITDYHEAREVYRQKELRQALYDAGEVIMADVLVNLHGAEHRDRRRLENRLFRRDTFELYERHLFPPIIDATLAPEIEAGRAELVDLGHRMMMNLAALSAAKFRDNAGAGFTLGLCSGVDPSIGFTNATVGLIVKGTDSPNAEGYLAEVAAANTDVDRLRFTGYVAEADVPRLFTEASAVVFPYTSTTGSSGALHQTGT